MGIIPTSLPLTSLCDPRLLFVYFQVNTDVSYFRIMLKISTQLGDPLFPLVLILNPPKTHVYIEPIPLPLLIAVLSLTPPVVTNNARYSVNYKQAWCERGIATRGCSGGNGSDELSSRSLVERCGQRDASIGRCPFRADSLKVQLETFPACMFVPGTPQGQPSYQHTLHSTLPFLHLECVIRLRRG